MVEWIYKLSGGIYEKENICNCNDAFNVVLM